MSAVSPSAALFLTPAEPDPAGSGTAQRAHQWLLRLAQEHSVHLVIVQRAGVLATPDEATARGGLAASCLRIAPTPGRNEYWRAAAWRLLGALLRGQAGPVVRRPEWAFLTSAAKARLNAWLEGKRFARVVCFRMQMIDYARHCVARGIISRERLEVDLDDWESATRRSMAEMYRRRGRKREARRVAWEAWRLERIERALAREAGRVWVAAPEDAHGLARRLAGVRVGVMPNGIPTLPPAAPAAGEDRTALFVGTFGYFPNQDAAQFFAEEVLPRLRRRDPRWRFIVVGRAAPPEFAQQIAAGAGVEFLGAADDLAPIYRRAALIVAPVRGGGGTKVKVIEGLATGRPVIATAHAARGLGLRAGETFLCAEAAEEWVAACERVAGDPSLAARVGAAGRAWVAEHFVHRRAGEAPAGPGVPPQS